uniref:Uncharacterized protein n=1 Tax=Rhizophora mucronata TaxID=61149 RepID=A0A2P2P6L7_RHIMU
MSLLEQLFLIRYEEQKPRKGKKHLGINSKTETECCLCQRMCATMVT